MVDLERSRSICETVRMQKTQWDWVTGWIRGGDKLPLDFRLIQLDGCGGHH